MSRNSFIVSGLLHIILIILMVFGLPSLLKHKAVEDNITIVEILPVRGITNVKPSNSVKKPVKKIEKKKEEIIKQEDLPPKEQAKPKPKAKPAKKQPEPEPEDRPVEKEIIPLKEKELVKKEEKTVAPKKTEDNFEDVLKSVEALKDLSTAKEQQEEVNKNFDKILAEADPTQYKPGLPLSLNEKDAIKEQIKRNWNVLVGSKDDNDMVVTVKLHNAPDGSIIEVDFENHMRYSTDSRYRAFVDSTIRAVKASSPLKGLPAEKYDVRDGWRDVEINFSLKEMY